MYDPADFTYGDMNTGEIISIVIFVLLETMTACIFIYIAVLVFKARNQWKRVREEKDAIMKELEAVDLMKYEQLKQSEAPKFCGLCFTVFKADNSIA